MNKVVMILGGVVVAGGIYYLVHNDVLHFPPHSEAKVVKEEQSETPVTKEEKSEAKSTKETKSKQKHMVIVFGTPHCHYCTMAKQFLEQRNIHYIDKDITEDDARAEMDKYVPGAKYVPQIVIGETAIGGYSELIELQHQGKLRKMINGN
jgi:glutaredoxin 3